jgi:hypothetical protein
MRASKPSSAGQPSGGTIGDGEAISILNGGEAGRRDDGPGQPGSYPPGTGLLAVQQIFCYAWPMITLRLQDAQRELPVLADKALRGEEVFITVGQDKLRLSQATDERAASHEGPRPGRGAWKGRINVPDAFYEPWTDEEIGESEA